MIFNLESVGSAIGHMALRKTLAAGYQFMF